jgi:putative DNA primase/helicase
MMAIKTRFYTEATRWTTRYPVFPCNGKLPAIPQAEGGHGCIDGTMDDTTVRQWSVRYPNANVGITFRRNSPEVGIDVDVDNMWWLDERQAEHGILETKMVKTGKGGYHLYFLRPKGVEIPNVSKKANRGFECKSHNQYLMAPGSIHPETGNVYEIVQNIDPQPMPDWLIDEILHANASKPAGDARKPGSRHISEGEGRNAACTAEAGRLLNIYRDPEIVRPMVWAYNQAVCVPPLTDEENARTWEKSLKRWAAREVGGRPGVPPEESRSRSDLGNMDRLLSAHRDEMRFCKDTQDWYTFDGKRWARGQSKVINWGKQVARDIYREAAAIEDKDARAEMWKWARASESSQHIEAMVRLARSEDGIEVALGDFDRDQHLLNCRNETVDLRTGEGKPHDRADMITRLIDIDYVPGERSAAWEAFLEQVLPDAETRATLQRAIGYSATGSQDEQAMFFVYGREGANGKTTTLGACEDVLGPYAHECEPTVFMVKNRGDGGPNEDIANLRQVRFLVSTELEPGQKLSVGIIKRATGGERLTSNRKYEHAFTFKPEFKLWLCGNHEPQIDDTTTSIWRRLHKIPFNMVIPEGDRIKGLRDILSGQNGEAILAWIVAGAVDCFQGGGLRDSEAVLKATAAYRKDQDMLALFIEERCLVNMNAKVVGSLMFKAYQDWAMESGVRALQKQAFNTAMREKSFDDRRGTGNKPTWFGVGLLEMGTAG